MCITFLFEHFPPNTRFCSPRELSLACLAASPSPMALQVIFKSWKTPHTASFFLNKRIYENHTNFNSLRWEVCYIPPCPPMETILRELTCLSVTEVVVLWRLHPKCEPLLTQKSVFLFSRLASKGPANLSPEHSGNCFFSMAIQKLKESGIIVPVCNTSPQEAEAGESWILG